jgi:endonuclease G, mitochondrial
MDLQGQQRSAAERYRLTAGQRSEIKRKQEATGLSVVDTEEQIAARAERMLAHGGVSVDALARAMTVEESAAPSSALERIVGAASELQEVNFLGLGARAAKTVAKVTTRAGRRVTGYGTGFLVGDRLLMTNNHVLPDAATAATSFIEFDYERDPEGLMRQVVAFDLDPDTLFLTHEHLDMTLVAVRPGPDGRTPGERYGWNQLIASQGKIVVGEPVNVVGHPEGRPKEIAIRRNALLLQLDDFLQYEADTLPGDSGAPAYNDQWEVVALHHSGVPETVGGVTTWVANEGVRVSVLLAHLAGLDLPPAKRAVLATLGGEALPPATVPPVTVVAAAPVAPASTTPASIATASIATAPLLTEALRGGLAGRALPSGRKLVFLHGRGAQGSDPAALRAHWAGGLARGLAVGGLPPIDAADVWFPFYGNVLVDAMSARELALGPADVLGGFVTTAEAMAPDGAAARGAYEDILREAASAAGMPDTEPEEAGFVGGVIAALQRPLSWLANRSGLDEFVIAAAFRDVAAYLERDGVRQAVLARMLAEIPDEGDIVLVSHSLGTVVAMDLLTRLPAGVRVPLLVTAGSPLGMDAVFKRLLAGGPVRPPVVRTWVNAWAAPDAIAIGCPLGGTWADVRDIRTNNPKDRAHEIGEYLSDGRVATTVGDLVR